MNIGWIGLGNMGIPMVENLTKRQFSVDAFHRRALSAPVGHANVTSNLGATVGDKDVVVLMVPDLAAVEDVLFTSDALSKMKSNTLIVNMSTIGVSETHSVAKRVQEKGYRYMDAPVLGSVKPAQDGTLTVVAGGDDEDFRNMKPVFETFSKASFLIGGIGQGAAMKLLVNAFLGLTVEALAETVSLGQASQLSRELILDVLETSAVWSPVLAAKKSQVLENEFPAQFALQHLFKDLNLAIRHGADVGVELPAVDAALQSIRNAVDAGYGAEDMASVVKYRSEQ